MAFVRVIRFTLLVFFAVFAAGGPALHYAPFLGFHDCGSHSVAQAENEVENQTGCGCGQLHHLSSWSSTNQAAALAVSEDSPKPSGCDGECAVCNFFDQVNFDLVTADSVASVYDASESARTEWVQHDSHFEHLFFCRGPPVGDLPTV